MRPKSRHKISTEIVVVCGLKLIIETRIIISSNGIFLYGHVSKKIKEIDINIS